MIRRPPRSTHCISSAASDVYKRQVVSTQSTWGINQFLYIKYQKKISQTSTQIQMNFKVILLLTLLVCAFAIRKRSDLQRHTTHTETTSTASTGSTASTASTSTSSGSSTTTTSTSTVTPKYPAQGLVIPNCKTYSTDATYKGCTACLEGYQLSDNYDACYYLMANCASSLNKTTCSKCNSGYQLVSKKWYEQGTDKCVKFPNYILNCANQVKDNECNQCKTGFVIVKNGEGNLCVKTIPNCKEQSSNSVCKTCADNYVKVENVYAFDSCIPNNKQLLNTRKINNCAVQYEDAVCITCDSSYYLLAKTGSVTADQCILKGKNCDTQTKELECATCPEGYKFDDNGKDCNKIIPIPHCESQDFSANTGSCSTCEEGYIKLTNGKQICSKKIEGCKIQDTEKDCTTCLDGYLKQQIGEQQRCILPIPNCVIYEPTYGKECKTCKDGYSRVSGKNLTPVWFDMCVPTIENCVEQISQYICKECSVGYTKKNNASVFPPVPDKCDKP
eukprot:TRINITY_DN28_c0_g1_i3.p1 TRINITY_DN28_c0_g1~~TRINITY_DN28_c0_g1_i3.p1  ORF type:complete len:503 (-),score=97.54 TRINITY_DN28_c0_g1_i3:8-1516(-)